MSYLWNNGSTQNTLTNLCSGLYVVTATDGLGCNATDSIYVGTIIYGCTDSTAYNYNPQANTDDGSCIGAVYGCTDPIAFNYDPGANIDDGSCYAKIFGCLDSTASNYNDYDGDLSSNPLTGDVLVDVNTNNGICFPAFVSACSRELHIFNFS